MCVWWTAFATQFLLRTICNALNNANDNFFNTVCDGNAITNDLTGKILCDVPTNGNVFLAATLWDVYTDGNVSRGLTVWDVLTTGNYFAYIIVFFEHHWTYFCIWVLADRTRPHFAESVCQEGISLTVSGSCGKDPPLSPTLTRWWFRTLSRKAVKNRLYSTDVYQC